MHGTGGEQGTRARCDRLVGLVDTAWQRGWRPADLHGYVARHWDALTAKVLGDAMAANLARYAPATVTAGWHDHLEQISASVWWSPETDHLRARAARTSGGAAAIDAATGILEVALGRLPEIERLDPLPGQAVPGRSPVDADERLLTRVRMMLAKAESTPYEAEAEAFTAAAHSLMARHSIDRALLDASADARRSGGPRATRIPIAAPYAKDKFGLLSAVARANRCRAVWHEHFGFGTVIGHESELRAVELLFASLLVQASTAMLTHRSTGSAGDARVFRRSFLSGFAVRIAERLADATAEQTRAAAADADRLSPSPARSAGAGTDIVRVLADREREVDDAVGERFPHLSTMRSRARLDVDGWISGRAAGDRASLGAHPGLDSA
ncbi:DUF2786 domain-containing protein [Nostocoides sp. F2B08]|uniref:DUF2786 domain-containing protein n=1 Tax=Nostocoides sp. F2B08 TaxID=2653936 RepID=UPI0012633097|nr:DUF2786 domain-containing protein [Tetrasphaera sp. F2B08]KAB7743227.1 DUF2786 domain-containing protein [Tetrasphaera sp. F2B08]